jgi:NodT family efflux transporter outer membrane factor (OMF) lipoprotein
VRRALSCFALAALLGAVLAGCAAGPNYRAPKPDVPAAFIAAPNADAMPAAVTPYSAAPLSVPPSPPTVTDLAGWWHALEDKELDSLVERAIKGNPDLEIALTRLQQARTYEAGIIGSALPQIDASGAVGKGTGSDISRGRADNALRSADNSTGLQHLTTIGGFDTVWEIDLFGKYRREIEAARDEADAAAAARRAAITTLVADVARAYIDLRGLQVRSGVLHHAAELLRESLGIVQIRYNRGITNELDVALAAREYGTLEAQIAPVDAQVAAAEYTLAALLGEYPDTLVEELKQPALIPSVPAAAAPGVPLELLKRRPDIQLAERELAASTARIGVATANLYPQVSLVAAIGAQAQDWGVTPNIGKHIWSFGPGAVWPVLDFGTLDAKVDIAHLATHAQLVDYRRTIINAVQEVDSAVHGYSAQQSRLKDLGDAMLAAQRAVDLANARYDRGLTDFLNVVDAERQFYVLQEEYAAAQVAQGEEFVKLYKALGGGWENYQSVPAIRRPQPAILAAFRRALSPATP